MITINLDEIPEIPFDTSGLEASVVMGSCAYCGATRPMNELEYCAVTLNGELVHRFFCHERRKSYSLAPKCAIKFQNGAEG